MVSGTTYQVDTDFRRWIEFQAIISSGEENGRKAERLLEFMQSMGLPPSVETLDAMVRFYTAASTEKGTGGSRQQAFDFEKDSEFIYSAFLECYGVDLSVARLHWWRFKAMFKSLPQDCELCRIMGYRTIDLSDVPKSQKRFYREMKARYSLGQTSHYKTEQEMKDYVKKRYEEAKSQMSQMRSGERSGLDRPGSEEQRDLAQMQNL